MNPNFFEEFLQFGIRFSTVSGKLLRQCKPDSLTPLQFEILRIIESDTAIALSELCNCADIAMPNASREIKKLVAMELVKKTENAHDKRTQMIGLSERGEEMMSEAYGELMKIVLHQYKDLTQSDIDTMTKNFNTLRQLI